MSFSKSERTQGAYYHVGLKNYLVKVYNYMAFALGITGIVAFFVASSGLSVVVHSNLFLSLIVTLSPMALVIFMQYRIAYLSMQAIIAVFAVFAALMGVSISYIFLIYAKENIARAFFIASIMFGSMALYGNNTKRDLTDFGSFLLQGILGIIIASIVNLFFRSSALYFAISLMAVIVFTLITAYDAQKVKDIYYKYNDGSEIVSTRLAVLGATTLYFNFLNIFLHLLNLLHVYPNDRD